MGRLYIFRRSLGELAICRHETIPSKCSNVRESEQTHLDHIFSVSVSTSQWGISRIPGATRLATGQSLRASRLRWVKMLVRRCHFAPPMAAQVYAGVFSSFPHGLT